MTSQIHPAYQVTYIDADADRLQYTPDRPWPNPGRSHLHIQFSDDTHTVYFDEKGRPSDVGQGITEQERQRIRTRRKTPRGSAHATDF